MYIYIFLVSMYIYIYRYIYIYITYTEQTIKACEFFGEITIKTTIGESGPFQGWKNLYPLVSTFTQLYMENHVFLFLWVYQP